MQTTSVEIRNQELTLEGLRAETQTTAADLSQVLQQTTEATAHLEQIRKEAAAVHEQIAEERNKLQVSQLELDEKKREWDSQKGAREKEIAILADQKKAAMRDLHNINEWIFKANEEYEQKQHELRDLNKEIAEAHRLAERVLAIQDEIVALEEQRTNANIEYSLARDNALIELKDLEWKKQKAIEIRDKAVEETLEAENDRQRTIQERKRIQQDLEVYVRRIEAHYQKAFPELHMKL